MHDRWIYRRATGAVSVRLFCFPYAGGTAAVFSRWQDELPDDIEVCAVEMPGRRHRLREQPFRRMDDLVEAVSAGLAPYTDVPFAFFGHSLGAVVAFELARHLRRCGGPRPSALFLSGAAAPQLPRAWRPLWKLPDPEFLAEVRAYGGTPDEVLAEPGIMEVFLPILRADFELFDTYAFAPEAPLDQPTHLYGGDGDPRVSPARLWAWRELAEVHSVELFPGGHFYLHDERRPLTAAIARALAGHRRGSAAA